MGFLAVSRLCRGQFDREYLYLSLVLGPVPRTTNTVYIISCPLHLAADSNSEGMMDAPKDGKYGTSIWHFEITEESPYGNVIIEEMDSAKGSKDSIIFTLCVRSLKDLDY